MKVRFYCDVPPYKADNYHLWASTAMPGPTMPEGWKRIVFDVDFPPDVQREFDVKAPAEYKGVV